MGNCVQSKRRSFVAKKYRDQRTKNREERLFSANDKEVDRTHSFSRVQSLPKKPKQQPIHVEEEEEYQLPMKHSKKPNKISEPLQKSLGRISRGDRDQHRKEQFNLDIIQVPEYNIKKEQHRQPEGAVGLKKSHSSHNSSYQVQSLLNNLSRIEPKPTKHPKEEVMTAPKNKYHLSRHDQDEVQEIHYHSTAKLPEFKPISETVKKTPIQHIADGERMLDLVNLKDIQINIHCDNPNQIVLHTSETQATVKKTEQERKVFDSIEIQTIERTEKKVHFKIPMRTPNPLFQLEPEVPPASNRTPHPTKVFLHNEYFKQIPIGNISS